jgi:hypothetical protein
MEMVWNEGPASDKHAELVVKFVDRVFERNRRCSPRDIESKKFEVKNADGRTFVVLEVGMVGDEGSAASIYCRDYRHVVIGKRGGIELLNPKPTKRTKKVFKTAGGWFNAVHALT